MQSWHGRDFSPGVLLGPRPTDDLDRHEGVVGSEPPGSPLVDGPFARSARAISEYRIFPTWLGERIVERTPVQVGDDVGLRYYFLPGIHLFIASRVIDTFAEQKEGKARSGFTYRTLQGHIELGEETFAVEKNLETGIVSVSLQAWSRPGHWLTRIGYWYARRSQCRAGRAAIANLQQIAAGG